MVFKPHFNFESVIIALFNKIWYLTSKLKFKVFTKGKYLIILKKTSNNKYYN